MAKMKFELNPQGVRDLLKSNEIAEICINYAHDALGRLGAGYEVNTYLGEKRFNAEIEAVTFEAKKDNLENNSILKSLRG